ncbi:pesticin C-terminus-like muramidase [Flaviaesturariibacter amylovorans]|uniref:Pesticin C-terminal domain-containing protein n=1 Tax=Flaviaesturariibacter amylovorans TaxID=1084520 RepID=A0ABP8HRC6_9BACT
MAGAYAIDWDFISNKEGGTKTKAYVPVCTAKSVINPENRTCFGKPTGTVIGKSGVTIAAGVDLGQMNEHEFSKLKLPAHLETLLKPFVGKKKDEAVSSLQEFETQHNTSVQITMTDAKIINQRLKEKTVGVLAKNFDRDSNVKFDELPAEAQTALASLAFQYGPNFHAKENDFLQKVWDGYTKQDYNALANTLENAPEYKGRRKEEAAMLKGMGYR